MGQGFLFLICRMFLALHNTWMWLILTDDDDDDLLYRLSAKLCHEPSCNRIKGINIVQYDRGSENICHELRTKICMND